MKNQIFSFAVSNTESGLEIKRDLLGNKGANLADMCTLGIPIPPGFILSTEFCKAYMANDSKLSSEMVLEIQNYIKKLENKLLKKFGTGDNPLLVSVRSGAVVSMPGMMDTVLNIGLNDEIVERLAKYSGNPVFAYDSYRRLIQMYSSVVLEIDEGKFDHILLQYGKQSMQSLQDLQEIIEKFKNIVLEVTGEQFPQDVEKQLTSSIEAVFQSWNSERARIYRDKNLIDHNLSTAATIQTMVFGNVNENSCTGVLFTRNPISGDKNFFGEFLPRAQGEDVVSGYLDTFPLTKLDAERSGFPADLSMEFSKPEIFKKLIDMAMKLEIHYQEMQDIEFTVQDGHLWILQTRSGKRSPAAAAKIAIDMVNEGLKTEKQALDGIDINCIEQSIYKQLIVTEDLKVIANGLATSPGAAAGVVALTPQRAEILAKNYPVILIRSETNPDDISGMYAAEGILTGRGGVTSHAAVVARGIGKPCICSVENFHIIDTTSVSINGTIFNEGDYITINGSTGEVFSGNIPMTASGISTELLQIMSWAKKHKKISVLANAETPEDVKNAMLFEAEGVGLCRTEHMFFADDRINDVRNMILAKNLQEREVLLKKISQYQKDDFKKLFKILDGKTICIRLLDPPLHEFLPQTESDLKNFCDATKNDLELVRNAVQSLYEHNPMLGHRGVRLGISYPEIYKSQIEAIFQAMIEYKNETGQDASVEIMIPLIFSENELIFMKNTIQYVRETTFATYNLKYKFGAMIELPRIALTAEKLCDYVDFISFGTNDLTQTTFGISRDDSSKFINEYKKLGILKNDPFVTIDREGVGELIKIAVNKIKSKNPMIKIGICGEHGGNVESINFFHSIGLDYVSCSPYRIPVARLTASRL